ncbi:MAG: DUF2026 family protein [Gammaproteobacteria bacterium]|nr:DUF2026 family protein [Gammaproteobacteria bacterium]
MLITLPDYRRIYSTIHSLLLADEVGSHEASFLLSVYGAQILKRHYGIAAQPVVGSAAYHLGLQAKVLAFGEYKNGRLESHNQQHHCWVEADGWLIDFMAPLFPVLVKRAGKDAKIDAWMMQKPMAKAKKTLGELRHQGDFYVLENDALASQKMSQLVNEKAHIQRGKLAVDWFVKAPKKMPSPLNVNYEGAQDAGKKKLIAYKSFLVSGAW